ARRWHRVMAETRQLLGDVVARRRALADLDQRTDALSLLISMTDDDGRHLTDEEIIDGVLTLLQAGHESSAAQLTWLLELLLHYPHTMERLTAELREGREEYLEAAIKESQRVHPALPVG